jgi:membrane protein implicated in regulation of membrane protease activity
MEFAFALFVLLALVAFVVIRPFVRGDAGELVTDDRRAALEAAKEAKYREIRDTELDYRMGKLAEEDWRASDRELRAQAIEILRELDAIGETPVPGGNGRGAG